MNEISLRNLGILVGVVFLFISGILYNSTLWWAVLAFIGAFIIFYFLPDPTVYILKKTKRKVKGYIDEIQGDTLCISNGPYITFFQALYSHLKSFKEYRQIGTFRTDVSKFKEHEWIELKKENGKIIEVKKWR